MYRVANLTSSVIEVDGVFFSTGQSREIEIITEDMLAAKAAGILSIIEISDEANPVLSVDDLTLSLTIADVNTVIELTNSTGGTGDIILPTVSDFSRMVIGGTITLLRASALREWNFDLNGNTIVGSQTVKMPDAGGSATVLKTSNGIYIIGAVPQ